MDATVLATLSRLLDEALDRSPDERSEWLESLGPEYDTVKPRLKRLLGLDGSRDTGGFLGTLPRFGPSDTNLVETPDGSNAQAGAEIGPYRLVRPLEVGGMGAVWLAERLDGLVKRPVALKLPRGAWRRLGLAERMAREREILASLDHPYIARLYDAGIAPDGQPYLALEYVDGRPIDQYCRDAQLGVEARLRLFQQVVSAVSHAHARLVVHRDLKPSNILVTSEGQVRLLDFGIAKLLEQSADRDSTLTEVAGRALTPDYASPEQISGAPIGTASDVYALGVVLYELLTGVRPYRLKRDSAAALEEAILEAEPLRPSQVVDGALRKALGGDLDWIVARAMQKDPDQRYPSADAFGADIERHFRQQPVEAAAPSAAYLLGKFARRHRVGLAISAVVMLALLGGIVGTTTGLVRARTAEASAQASAEAARVDAATADRVTQFMLDLFKVTTPEEADGRNVTAREMLDRGAARVRAELAQEPLVQARMLQALGDAYSALALYPEARGMLENAVTVARSLGERGERDLALALYSVGQLRRRLDDMTGAESAVREALSIRERLDGLDSVELGPLLNELAMLLRTKDPGEAERLYRRTYDILVAAHGPGNGDAGVVLANIGSLQSRTRRYADARETLTQALAMVTRHHGEHDPRVAGILGNLALAERELGNTRRALELHSRDLELSTQALGPDHPAVGTIWLNLARSTQRLGEYATALDQVERALGIFRKHFGAEHVLVLTSQNSRALYLDRLSRTAAAESLLRSQLALTPESAEARAALLVSRLHLADMDRRANRRDEALALVQAVLDDPHAARDLRLQASAHWARACALATHAPADAELARARARQVQDADPQATAQERQYAEARSAACAGDRARALRFLQEAAASGSADSVVLDDPIFSALRGMPAFEALATAAAPGAPPSRD
ncbi:MAG: tetratricopeptide repeat protein [Vicinamibacterales bacterium]